MAFLKKAKRKKERKKRGNGLQRVSPKKKASKIKRRLEYSQAPRILIRPIISEKATQQKKYNQYLFEIAPYATKSEVKRAIKSFYKVGVEKVNIVKMRGKLKRFGREQGRRKNWKKAVVKLKKGEIIEF